MIGGWVALWRPLEIFLYDWWPIRRKQNCSTASARWTCGCSQARGMARRGRHWHERARRRATVSTSDAPRRADLRAVAFFLLWMVLMQSVQTGRPRDRCVRDARDLGRACGSFRRHGVPSLRRAAALLPHFVWESVLAGSTSPAARSTRAALTGFVSCPLGFPPGFARNTFATITSLMPGAVRRGERTALVYHCLDTAQPVVEQLWQEERLLARALVAGRRHD